jgi:hypothetical protein
MLLQKRLIAQHVHAVMLSLQTHILKQHSAAVFHYIVQELEPSCWPFAPLCVWQCFSSKQQRTRTTTASACSSAQKHSSVCTCNAPTEHACMCVRALLARYRQHSSTLE